MFASRVLDRSLIRTWQGRCSALANDTIEGSSLEALMIRIQNVLVATDFSDAAQALEDCVREWLAPAARAGLQTDVIVAEGNPAASVLAHADALHVDLLVMG